MKQEDQQHHLAGLPPTTMLRGVNHSNAIVVSSANNSSPQTTTVYVDVKHGSQVVSVYRQILFLTLVAMGQDNIDLTAFDRYCTSITVIYSTAYTNNENNSLKITKTLRDF